MEANKQQAKISFFPDCKSTCDYKRIISIIDYIYILFLLPRQLKQNIFLVEFCKLKYLVWFFAFCLYLAHLGSIFYLLFVCILYNVHVFLTINLTLIKRIIVIIY